MGSAGKFTKTALRSYCKLAAAAVRHSVPLEDILTQTRLYHGEEFAGAVEEKIKEFI